MKKLVPRFLLASLVMFNAGCAGHINNIMRSWEGHHYGDLIASWGPPQQVFDDGLGGRILVWTSVRSFTTPGHSSTYTTGQATMYDSYIWGSASSYTTYSPAQTYGWTAYRMFWISREGYIYRWAWRGL